MASPYSHSYLRSQTELLSSYLKTKLNTMTTEVLETKQRKPRTPRNVDHITKGALSLPMRERADLARKLKESVEQELETIKEAAAQAEKIYSEIE